MTVVLPLVRVVLVGILLGLLCARVALALGLPIWTGGLVAGPAAFFYGYRVGARMTR